MSGRNTVYILRLDPRANVASIRSFLSEPVANVPWAIQFVPSKDSNFKRAKVQFVSSEAAERFIIKQHNHPIPGTTGPRLVVRFWVEDKEKIGAPASKIVHIAGLPLGSTSESVMAKIPPAIQMAVLKLKFKSNGSRPAVTIFPANGNSSYCTAKIVFINKEKAQEFINYQDKRPLRGETNKVSVSFWKDDAHDADQMENKQANKPRTIIMNVVYVKGLPLDLTKKMIENALQYNNWDMKKIGLHFHVDGIFKGSAVLTFGSQRSAATFIEKWNRKQFPKRKNILHMQHFESTKFRRHPNADKSKKLKMISHAYDCVICFDIWIEEDMIGCVPIGKKSSDMDTHFICPDCTVGHARAQLSVMNKNHGTGLPCGAEGCDRVTLWAPAKRLLPADVVIPLDKIMTNAAVAGQGIEFCKNCPNGYLFEGNNRFTFFFKCHECHAHFCRKCKIDYAIHVGKSCADVDPKKLSAKEKRVQYFEAKRVAIMCRKCPGCNNQGIKVDGCNSIRCKYMNCDTLWCYVCGQKIVEGTNHFGSGACKQFENVGERIQLELAQLRLQVSKDPLMRGYEKNFWSS